MASSSSLSLIVKVVNAVFLIIADYTGESAAFYIITDCDGESVVFFMDLLVLLVYLAKIVGNTTHDASRNEDRNRNSC